MVIDNLGPGGAQTQLVNLGIGLKKIGHDINYFIYHPYFNFYREKLKDYDIHIYEYYKKMKFDIGVLINLNKIIKKGNYDAVISFLDGPNIYCEFLLAFKKKPILIASERISFEESERGLFNRIRMEFHRVASAVVTNSYYCADQILTYAPFLNKKLSIIYNGIDTDIYHPNNNLIKTSRLLGVGSIIKRKNLRRLAEALVVYKNDYGEPPIIEWAGTLYQNPESQEEYFKVKHIIERYGLEKYWVWLGECNNLQQYYPKYRGIILPSLREGLSNVICEAMACGVPVLASRVGENIKILNESGGGILFDPDSSKDIARAIHKLFQMNESEIQEMGTKARDYAVNNFSIEQYIYKFERLIFSLKKKYL